MIIQCTTDKTEMLFTDQIDTGMMSAWLNTSIKGIDVCIDVATNLVLQFN